MSPLQTYDPVYEFEERIEPRLGKLVFVQHVDETRIAKVWDVKHPPTFAVTV